MVSSLDMCSRWFNKYEPPAPQERGAITTLEATTGFEPVNGGFADLCLTTWLRRRNADSSILARRCQNAIDSGASVWYDIYQLISFELRIIENPTSPQMWGFVSHPSQRRERGEGAQR